MNLTTLPAEQKRAMWARIQAERPALAALLQDIGRDPLAQALIEHCDAEVLVESLDLVR
ncbi:MAG: hypothetical protein AB7U92_25105 [Piscinibacter sp.]|uniref:hypothetical protein n=1 Tax=Piscinibacter sp. TaxID=1903157 RepID=UPI003D09DB87